MVSSLIFYGVVLIVILVIGEVIARRFDNQFISRLFVHLTVGITATSAVFIISNKTVLITIATVFTFVNILIHKSPLLGMKSSTRPTIGTILFPLAYMGLLFCWWDTPYLIIYGMSLLTFTDGFSALGKIFVKSNLSYKLLSDKKSILGTLIGALVTALTTIIIIHYYTYEKLLFPLSLREIIFISVALILIVILLENLSVYGSDNITVPLGGSLFLHLFISEPELMIPLFYQVFLAASLLGIISLKKRWLNFGGVSMMMLISFVIALCGKSLFMLTPLLIFFILSSALSKLSDKFYSKNDSDQREKKGSTRDGWQVFANGSVPALFMIIYYFTPTTSIFIGFIVSIGAATSDTWSSEIGRFSRTTPRSIITLTPMKQGLSGGVTLLGTMGGVLGTITLSLLVYFLYPQYQSFPFLFILIIGGILGTIIDSMLGAMIQVKYRCPHCNDITEKEYHCDIKTEYFSGFSYVNNDTVNWISISLSATVTTVFTLINHFPM